MAEAKKSAASRLWLYGALLFLAGGAVGAVLTHQLAPKAERGKGVAVAEAKKVDRRIPAIDAHLHSQHQQLNKLVYMGEQNNVRAHIVVGSPKSTLGEKGGFTGWRFNNDELLAWKRDKDPRVAILPTVDPEDPEAPELLCRYVIEDGAIGLKLYDGHGGFHDDPLDSENKKRVYQVAEDLQIPILYHVNMKKFQGEFEAILEEFPGLTVVVPHYMLWWKKQRTLGKFLDAHPNVFTDTSFGGDSIMLSGLKSLSKQSANIRDFYVRYRDRILFGSDVVITGAKRKFAGWCADKERCMLDLLQKAEYDCSALDRQVKKSAKKRGEAAPPLPIRLKGMGLAENVLRDIFYRNAVRVHPSLAELFTEEELGADLVAQAQATLDKRRKAREGVDCSKYRVQ